MSRNINQIFIANPITTNNTTDLMYFGRSPYGVTDDTAMTYANFSAQFVLSTAIINPAHGGTGINNGASTITIGGNFSLSGAFAFVGTLTAPTSVTFPVSGTLATTAQLPFPITPYVVGPVGLAGYQTIQSALDAANAAGGGAVYIQPSATPYTEDLSFYDNVSVVGVSGNSDVPNSGDTVTIVGVHTPPNSGYMSIKNCYLQSATDIFFSTNSGTAKVVLGNCVVDIANGYIWNMVNWVSPGAFIGFNNQDVSIGNNGVINNTGQASLYLQDSIMGSGAGVMIASGSITMKNVDFNIPIELRKNSIQNIDNCRFLGTVTATVNCTGVINFSRFDPSNNAAAFVMNSTDPIRLSNCLFNTSNNPCIDGTGGGLLTLTSATFIDNAIIAGTVNIAAASAFLPASFGATGQVFTSNGPGVIPSFQTPVPPVPGITNVNQTTSSATLVANSRYATNNGASLVTYTIPAGAVVGDTYIIVGGSSGGWTVHQPASVQIHLGNLATTSGVGGSISSTNQYDCITITCVASNVFSAYAAQGNLTVV